MVLNFERVENDKMRSDDRYLVLKPLDGLKPKDVTGRIDPRLFSGENKLMACMDTQTTLWQLKYEYGQMSPAFNQKFTSFKQLKQFADTYFKRRNMQIVEVKD